MGVDTDKIVRDELLRSGVVTPRTLADMERRRADSAPAAPLLSWLVDHRVVDPTHAENLQRSLLERTSAVSRIKTRLGQSESAPFAIAETSGTSSETSNLPRPFGPYRLLRRIARGGMGVVYLAEHVTLRRRFALKMLLAWDGASEEEIARFLKEARAASRLLHEGIVAVHDVGEVSGQYYLTMDYVEGETLAAEIQRGPLRIERALTVVRDIARAVAHAHANGIIHRDLKPGNVLLDSAAHPHLTDFGLAKVLASTSAALTKTGDALGTPAYMAPEQALGALQDVDERSDVYALGVILYEALTGDLPFSGESALAVMQRVIMDEPQSPRDIASDIPPDVEAVCLKAMAKPRAERYASASLLAAELDRALAGQPVLARPRGSLARLWLRIRKRSRPILLACALAILTGAPIAWAVHGEATRRAEIARLERELEDRLAQGDLDSAAEALAALESLSPLSDVLARERPNLEAEVVERDRGRLAAEQAERERARRDAIEALRAHARALHAAGRAVEIPSEELWAAAGESRDPELLRLHCASLLARGDAAGAERSADAACELDPRDAETLLLLGELRAQRRDPRAEEALRLASEFEPADPRPFVALALVLRRRFALDEAMEALARAQLLAPDDPAIAREIGETYRYKGDLGDAIPSYTRALVYSPDDPLALYGKGVSLANLGEEDAAKDLLARAAGWTGTIDAATDDRRRAVAANLAAAFGAHLEAGRADAERALQRAIALEPADFEVEVLSARLALERGDPAGLARTSDLLGHFPTSVEVLVLRARALRMSASSSGDQELFAQAKELLDRALATEPRAVEALRDRGLLLMQTRGNRESAHADFAALESLVPDTFDACYYPARLYEWEGHPEEAIRRYDLLLARRPSAYAILLGRGRLQLGLGQLAAAEQDLSAFLDRAPRDWQARFLRGVARFLAGQFEAAAEDFGEVRPARQRSGADSLADLAGPWEVLARLRAGDREGASRALQRRRGQLASSPYLGLLEALRTQSSGWSTSMQPIPGVSRSSAWLFAAEVEVARGRPDSARQCYAAVPGAGGFWDWAVGVARFRAAALDR